MPRWVNLMAAGSLLQRGAHGETMALSFTGKKKIRRSFGKIPEAGAMPNLIEVQKSSYDQFLQKDQRSYERIDEGLQAVFKSVFPIRDFSDRAVLEYVSYEFEEPKFDVEDPKKDEANKQKKQAAACK